MRRGKFEALVSVTRLKSVQILTCILIVYLLFMSLEIPLVLRTEFGLVSSERPRIHPKDAFARPLRIYKKDELLMKEESNDSNLQLKLGLRFPTTLHERRTPERRMWEFSVLSGLNFTKPAGIDSGHGYFELQKSAWLAWSAGKKLWEEMVSGKVPLESLRSDDDRNELCPDSILLSASEFRNRSNLMVIPCGLTLGSHIALVGRPHMAHEEYDPKISLLREGDEYVMVSQFIVELQGLKTVDGEDPPRILHFNPRLKGDWSRMPVIEQNTCYRMQWGSSLRCEGWKSRADEETVDGQMKCEKWIRDDDNHAEESETMWWLSRLLGRKKEVTVDWPYPFGENKLFVFTLSAGLEGYHVNVDGRHVTSFPYRTGFVLEDATGLYINEDIDVHSVFAASLPTSHPSFGPQKQLEMLPKWKAPPVSITPVEVFVGILSAGNHFAERMAVRKSWMQHVLVKSSKVIARFFVALHPRKEVNTELKKEAEYFGDIVIVPYMDNYDLVVLKTAAICEYGVHTVSAKFIMKCDDDTFVRLDAVLKETEKVGSEGSLYMGNMNYYHKPLRHGKWAVTYEEWPEEEYPPYANGPGYVISSDIAKFVVSEFEGHKLRLFKMEDVSMGMWVGKFNSLKRVEYMHDFKFCQFGCIENYWTAHYQSPRQMICLWEKLQKSGKARCCNMR